MITTKEMQKLEENSEYLGVSKLKLMENAGRSSAEIIKKIMRSRNIIPDDVLVIAGHGNNGGDGVVVARYLGCKVLFAGEKPRMKKEALINFKRLNVNQFVVGKEVCRAKNRN